MVGLKTTRGRTPIGPDMGIFLWGLAIEFAETRTVRDSAALLDALAGPDDGYFYVASPPRRSFLAAAMTPPEPLRIGVVESMPGASAVNSEINERLNATVKLLESLGHVCEPVRLEYDVATFNESSIRLWATTLGYFMEQFAQNTGRSIGPDNTEAVTLNIYRYSQSLKAVQLEEAMILQNAVSRKVAPVMRKYDVLLTPGLVRDVAKLGELDQNAKGVDMPGWWQQIIQDYSPFTPLFNTTGQPAIMLPLWQAKSGLPLAMQFAGRMGDEETLFSLSGQLEQALPWSGRRPANYA